MSVVFKTEDGKGSHAYPKSKLKEHIGFLTHNYF